MNKLIFKVVGVAATAALFCVGCSDNPTSGGEIGVVGDWLVVEEWYEYDDGEIDFEKKDDNEKEFISLSSLGDYVYTYFDKVGDFWIEMPQLGKYSVNGSSMSMFIEDNHGYYEEYGEYNISGNTLTYEVRQFCYNRECRSASGGIKAVRSNLVDVKKKLGKVYGQDPALSNTEWVRTADNWTGEEYISFYYSTSGYYHGYIPSSVGSIYEVMWYTENSKLTFIGLGCNRYEIVYDDGYEYKECLSYSIAQTVTLDYRLLNGILRLRRVGSNAEWDVWTPRSYENGSRKSRANARSFKFFGSRL